MPRACIIVLDAVGAGALPDAAEYGDEGSDTLGNVARVVRGLDLPNLEALGLGNVEPLEGCPPQAGAPAVALLAAIHQARGAAPFTVAELLDQVLEDTARDAAALGWPGRACDPLRARAPARGSWTAPSRSSWCGRCWSNR